MRVPSLRTAIRIAFCLALLSHALKVTAADSGIVGSKVSTVGVNPRTTLVGHQGGHQPQIGGPVVS
jgi:hypothetical protein